MKWDQHIQHIISKTKYPIFIFAKLKNYMGTKSLMIMYYAFFHSHINYGIISWGGVYKNNMNLLQNIQSRILKIIQRNSFVSNIPLNIRQVFTLESLVYHYSDLKEIYEKSTSVTRFKRIQLPKVQKVVSDKNSFRVAIKTFNCLPNELKKLCSKGANRKHVLKNKLEKYMQ